MEECKRNYLLSELEILAWGASVQRAGVYKQSADANEKIEFRERVIGFLSTNLLPQYVRQVSEETHFQNLERLVVHGSQAGEKVLDERGYKFGIAQKLLNLTLKYHWCLGAVVEPPHCPVDRIVIEKTKYKGKVNWTEMRERSEYENVMREIRRLADLEDQSIAMWELTCYTRR